MSDNIYENTVETAQPYPMEENHFKKFDITSKDIIFAVIFTVVSILMSAFGIFGGLRIGFTVAIIMLAAVMSIYLKTKEIGIKGYTKMNKEELEEAIENYNNNEENSTEK